MQRFNWRAMIGFGMMCLLLAYGQAEAKSTSGSSGILLKNPTSVRAEGMGGAQTALTTDEAGANGWNPAGLHGVKYPGVSAIYYRGLADDMYGAVNYEMAFDNQWTGGLGLLYYDAGSFELNTDADTTSTVPAQRDFLAVLTGAYYFNALSTGFTVGANLKLLQSTLLNQYSAFAAAVDLGARLKWGGVLKNLEAGLALKNIGTPIKYIDSADSLPSYMLFGLGYHAYRNSTFSVLVAGDGQYDLEKTFRSNLGAEIRILNMFAVRGGYKLNYDLGSFTVGAGFCYKNFELDYAFNPSQSLNSVHSASLKYTFAPVQVQVDNTEEKERAAAEAAAAKQLEEIAKKPEGPVEKIPVEILEIQRAGGRVSNVIMNMGSDQGIRVGFGGVILDAAGSPLATIIVRQVDPKLSLAEVLGLSRDISDNVTAVIEKPVEK